MKKYAIIVAGGSGTRMKKKLPKQFTEVAGMPLLMHTIMQFHKANKSITIIVVLPGLYIKKWETLVKKIRTAIPHSIVQGGSTRFESVKNGLKMVKDKGIVAIHDGVRPLASTKLINKCFSEAEKFGSAVPVVTVNESLRKLFKKQSKPVDRNTYVNVQTPQCFRSEVLLKAYQQSFSDSFTDDASVVESIGKKIHLVEGDRENIKITYPSDLRIAELWLKK